MSVISKISWRKKKNHLHFRHEEKDGSHPHRFFSSIIWNQERRLLNRQPNFWDEWEGQIRSGIKSCSDPVRIQFGPSSPLFNSVPPSPKVTMESFNVQPFAPGSAATEHTILREPYSGPHGPTLCPAQIPLQHKAQCMQPHWSHWFATGPKYSFQSTLPCACVQLKGLDCIVNSSNLTLKVKLKS